MLIIGLCGSSGSGKGTVCSIFEKFGIPSIDADAVYHELTAYRSSLVMKISNEFGNNVIASDGSLDRTLLSKMVFSDKTGELLKKLNHITHTTIIDETLKMIDEYKSKNVPAVIFDAPLLFESGFNEKCDIIILVTAPKSDKIDRIMERDGIEKEIAEKRLNSQLSDRILKERADYVIENDGSIDTLNETVSKIANKILNKEVYKNE